METGPTQGKAKEILLKAQEDSSFMLIGESYVPLLKGKYGGWLLRGNSEIEEKLGVWCFAVKAADEVPADALELAKPYVEKLKELASKLGVDAEPHVSLLTLSFKAARFRKKKNTENYTVYDMEVLDDAADAQAVMVHYSVRYTKKKRCQGPVCHVMDKLQTLARSEFKDAAVATADTVGVLIPYKTEEFEALVARLMEEAKKEEGEEEETAAEPVSGDAYLVVVVLKDEATARDVADKVRELLKEMKIRAEVKIINAEL
jgi:hypothetical protein